MKLGNYPHLFLRSSKDSLVNTLHLDRNLTLPQGMSHRRSVSAEASGIGWGNHRNSKYEYNLSPSVLMR